MNARTIPGFVTPKSDEAVLTALGNAIGRIKQRDNLSYGDIGVVLGRGADAATLYRNGNADMPITVWRRGVAAWGADFADPVLTAAGGRLCNNDVSPGDAMTIAAELAKLAAMLIEARSPTSPGGSEMHHTEVLRIADAATPVMPMLAAIIAQAALLRS